jgi:GntR family transcriptional repressor for pyruvate dehydrogenase complex
MPATLRRGPLVDAICERLARQYRSAPWLPPERALSARLGVSRSALREAVQRLEIQGLLEVQHGVGVRVVNKPQAPVGATLARELPDPDERLRQFAEVRLWVEPAIARAAAERAGPAERAALRAAHERLGSALDEAVLADLDFHRLLADLAGNRVLSLMLNSIAGLEAETRRITLAHVGLAEAAAQHARIVTAVERGDGDTAHAAMLAHVRAAQAAATAPLPAFTDATAAASAGSAAGAPAPRPRSTATKATATT